MDLGSPCADGQAQVTGEQLQPTTEEQKVLYRVEMEGGDWHSIRLPLGISFSEWSQEMVLASHFVVTFIPEFKWRTSATGKSTLLCTEVDYHLMVESLQQKKPSATVYIDTYS